MSADIVSDLADAIAEFVSAASLSTTRRADSAFATAIARFVEAELRELNVIDAKFGEAAESSAKSEAEAPKTYARDAYAIRLRALRYAPGSLRDLVEEACDGLGALETQLAEERREHAATREEFAKLLTMVEDVTGARVLNETAEEALQRHVGLNQEACVRMAKAEHAWRESEAQLEGARETIASLTRQNDELLREFSAHHDKETRDEIRKALGARDGEPIVSAARRLANRATWPDGARRAAIRAGVMAAAQCLRKEAEPASIPDSIDKRSLRYGALASLDEARCASLHRYAVSLEAACARLVDEAMKDAP